MGLPGQVTQPAGGVAGARAQLGATANQEKAPFPPSTHLPQALSRDSRPFFLELGPLLAVGGEQAASCSPVSSAAG